MRRRFAEIRKNTILGLLLLAFCWTSGLAQQLGGTLRGQVTDSLGGIVTNAVVTATDSANKEYTAKENKTFNSKPSPFSSSFNT